MKTIWKYELNPGNPYVIGMPEGAEILTVQVQNNVPCIWAKVDTEAELEERIFYVFATGQEIDLDGQDVYLAYIGTFQLNGGSLVFHVFELEP